MCFGQRKSTPAMAINGGPILNTVSIEGEKIHARHGYQWSHPVHEVLAWAGEGQPGPKIYAEGIQLDHRADPTKSRGQYLPLLELSVQEAPEDDRNMHYLGREYMFYGRWRECEVTLLYHLQMPTATWADERCASMRYIALAQEQQGKASAEQWYIRAVGEAPWLREPWLDYAKFLYRRRDWAGVYFLTGRALAIAERPRTYIIAADSWDSMPHDLRALACWHLGLTEEAVAQGEAALSLAQKEEVARLQENLAWYRGERA